MSKQYQSSYRQEPGISPNRGFTLIELMIVVVIVAVLASIAYPSYRNQVIKGNRAAAQGYMMSLASREEQIMLDKRSYPTALTNVALGDSAGLIRFSVPAEVSTRYDLKIESPNPITLVVPSYLITATPIAGGIQVPDGNLTLDSTGQKFPAGKW